jgi:hypothetical protein
MPFHILKSLAVVATAAALVACATTTVYQPAPQRGGYGYSETQIESNRARVNFRGNSSTSRETVENLLLYRCAELTLSRGFDHFIVTTRDTDARTRMQSYGGSNFYPGFYPHWRFYGRGHWRPWYDPFWDDFSYRQITQFEASAEITMYRGTKPADNPAAFDAREVQRNLQSLAAPPAPRSY